jgi:hypothetical protein
VIDLKWSGAAFRRDQLRAGTSYQLAAYAHLVADPSTAALPPVAYFIVREQRLLTTDGATFRDADRVEGPSADVTWEALLAGHRERRVALASGVLEAPAIVTPGGPEPLDEDGLVDGLLVLAPPCRFCDLQTLCGHVFMADV